ncbi:MAG: Holliday junction resolvase RuvX [Lautropia sp.]
MTGAEQTILAFDYGARRIGVAIGNTITWTARPLQTVCEEMNTRRFARIGALLAQWHPDYLVVGRPLHPDGTPHQITLAAERFARQLNGRFGLPVELVDERYSTVEARARRHDAMSNGRPSQTAVGASSSGAAEGDDAAAAAVILEQYLGGLQR